MEIDKLYPNANELIIDENTKTCKATIIDDDLDPIKLRFESDGVVTILTEGWTYLSLSYDNLCIIQGLMLDAEEYYNNLSKED